MSDLGDPEELNERMNMIKQLNNDQLTELVFSIFRRTFQDYRPVISKGTVHRSADRDDGQPCVSIQDGFVSLALDDSHHNHVYYIKSKGAFFYHPIPLQVAINMALREWGEIAASIAANDVTNWLEEGADPTCLSQKQSTYVEDLDISKMKATPAFVGFYVRQQHEEDGWTPANVSSFTPQEPHAYGFERSV